MWKNGVGLKHKGKEEKGWKMQNEQIRKELAWSENTAELKRKTSIAPNLKPSWNILVVWQMLFSLHTFILYDMDLFFIWISGNQKSCPATAP